MEIILGLLFQRKKPGWLTIPQLQLSQHLRCLQETFPQLAQTVQALVVQIETGNGGESCKRI